jgi:nucleoside-diphosphate-sugar epimerase
MDVFSGRRVLVTGATGFIGGHLCHALEQRGALLLRLSRSTGADVTDTALVDRLVADFAPQSLFHLASRVTGSRDAAEVLPTFRDNLLSTVNLLSAAHRHGVQRMLCMGSLQEPDTLHPGAANSPYAAAKQSAAAYVRMFASLYRLSVTIARPFMVYGPGQADTSKVLPHVLSRVLRGERAALSSGRHGFDWVHVHDVVDALLAIHAASEVDGQTVDIGTGQVTSVRDVVTAAARLLDAEGLLEFGVLPDRAGEPLRHADVAETRRRTGWHHAIDLEAGLRDTVHWYRGHPPA